MNGCKEDCCYVAKDFDVEMVKAKNNLVARDYVLPDFTAIRRGFMKTAEESSGKPGEGEQLVLAEAIVESVSACDPAAQPWLYRNILLTGGNMAFPGMEERLQQEVRTLAPSNMKVEVRVAPSPSLYPWQGGASLAKDPDLPQLCVTKEEYMEKGFQACQHRFYL